MTDREKIEQALAMLCECTRNRANYPTKWEDGARTDDNNIYEVTDTQISLLYETFNAETDYRAEITHIATYTHKDFLESDAYKKLVRSGERWQAKLAEIAKEKMLNELKTTQQEEQEQQGRKRL